jgi:DHA1 family bicyclomycin/chloramphenicol resistance-like MFS transporter
VNETTHLAPAPTERLGARPLEARYGVIFLLTAMTALGQFASNVYLPALPAVAADFSAPMSQVQWTLAVFLVVFALGQLVYGPLSDRFGRLAPLKLGLIVYLAGSIGAALAPTLAVLLACRAVQAAGGAAGIVIARAMVRDSFAGQALARVMALISIVFGLVPGLSPLVGGIATDVLDWRATFWLTAVLGVGVLAGTLHLAETNRRPEPSLDFRAILVGYRGVLVNRPFMVFALPAALIVGSLSAFFAGSPTLLIERIGISPTEYGFYPPFAVSGFMIGGAMARRMAGRTSPAGIVRLGLAIMLLGALLLAVPAMIGAFGKYQVAVAMVVHVSGLGLVMPTAIAAALSAVREQIGTASAVLGFLQMTCAALATFAVSLAQPLYPVAAFPVVMIVFTAASLLVFTSMQRSPDKAQRAAMRR